MLIDLNGIPQQAFAPHGHWLLIPTISRHPDLFNPLQTEILRIIDKATASTPGRAVIDVRQAGGEVLLALDSSWHTEFPRRFGSFPNGSAQVAFSLVLWNHLTYVPEWWCYSGIPDARGHGLGVTQYWQQQKNFEVNPACSAAAEMQLGERKSSSGARVRSNPFARPDRT